MLKRDRVKVKNVGLNKKASKVMKRRGGELKKTYVYEKKKASIRVKKKAGVMKTIELDFDEREI